jgi:peptidoglycan/xylan/chitin deacetylase (PgdA/CDA1 family)
MILETPLPSVLEFDLAGGKHRVEVANNPDSNVLDETHRTVWETLQPLDPATRQDALDAMAAVLHCDLSPRPSHAIMDQQDVQALENTPLSVGAHTVTHCHLPSLTPDKQSHEIVQSRDDCRKLTGKSPTTFAYPFGNYDDTAPEIVRSAGFQLAVTTEYGRVRSRQDAMLLPRVMAGNWSAAALSRRLP